MRIFVSILTVFICFFINLASAVELSDGLVTQFEKQNEQIRKLQQNREAAKLYAPNFVVIGAEAEFRVQAKPNDKIKFTLNYGSTIPKQYFEQVANDKGIAIFNPTILDDERLVGKSVDVQAIVVSDYCTEYQVAILQTENGTPAPSSRVYITDKDSEKGVIFGQWNPLTPFMTRNNTSEQSVYDVMNNQLYPKETPKYVRNMREAQDNVREFPENINYSD